MHCVCGWAWFSGKNPLALEVTVYCTCVWTYAADVHIPMAFKYHMQVRRKINSTWRRIPLVNSDQWSPACPLYRTAMCSGDREWKSQPIRFFFGLFNGHHEFVWFAFTCHYNCLSESASSKAWWPLACHSLATPWFMVLHQKGKISVIFFSFHENHLLANLSLAMISAEILDARKFRQDRLRHDLGPGTVLTPRSALALSLMTVPFSCAGWGPVN